MPIEEKKDRADYVIDNSGSLHQTLVQVRGILERLKIEAERKNSHASYDKSECTL
jgi:dephospho-CoA kinase